MESRVMRAFLVESVGEDVVVILNAIAQVLTLAVAAISYYELRTYRLVSGTLTLAAAARRYIVVGPFFAGVTMRSEGHPDVKRSELSPLVYCLFAVGILVAIIVTGVGPLTVLTYCGSQLWKVIAVWIQISLGWSVLLVPLRSLQHLLLAWIIFLLFVMGMTILVKTSLLACNTTRKPLNEKLFHLLLFVMFIVFGALVILTSKS
jgi:hypothetical protein